MSAATTTSLPSGDFIAGLVDGEGCFALKFRREIKENRANKPAYFGWQAAFVIVLRKDDVELLKKVQKVIGCGEITFSKNTARFQIQDTEELLSKIVPFFRRYKLYGKKLEDFQLWVEAVALIVKNKKKGINIQKGVRGFVKVDWNKEDLSRLYKIRELMLQYKSSHPAFKWGEISKQRS